MANLTVSTDVDSFLTGANFAAMRASLFGHTVTFAGNVVTTGAFNLTMALSATSTVTVFGSTTVPVFGQQITFAGPTAARTVTLPDASFAVARTDAANTFTGIQTLTNATLLTNGQVLHTVPSTDGHATGPTTSGFNCGYTSSAVGDLVYLDSSATWQKCDANTLALYNGMLGIALAVAASGAALLVALPGSFVYATGFPTFTIGSPVYMSETAGAITQTVPTTTDAATRVIGWAIHADKIYFSPSQDYVTHV